MSDNLKFEKLTTQIGQLTLSQPARRNALNAAMWAALPALLGDIAQDKSLKALIVTGDGDHFAAGADISEFSTLYANADSAARTSANIAKAMNALAEFPLPTVAMIRGACVGGGCGLALCCDIRFADNTAKFAITPAKLGLVYPFGDVQRLIETVGMAHAKDMLLSARLICAKTAKKMGLINFRHKPDELQDAVMDYLSSLASLSRQSNIVMKDMFKAYQNGQRGDTEKTQDWFLSGFTSEDFAKGYAAFLNKTKPDFN